VVQGAISRYAIHYADPRLCDDTPTETTAYNERCREIAREMFYIMSKVRRQEDVVKLAARHNLKEIDEERFRAEGKP
jgi:hypothetical protein